MRYLSYLVVHLPGRLQNAPRGLNKYYCTIPPCLSSQYGGALSYPHHHTTCFPGIIAARKHIVSPATMAATRRTGGPHNAGTRGFEKYVLVPFRRAAQLTRRATVTCWSSTSFNKASHFIPTHTHTDSSLGGQRYCCALCSYKWRLSDVRCWVDTSVSFVRVL